MSIQLKSTGEWTADTVRMFGETCWNKESCKAVADAHNAALAAAKSGGWLSQEALDEYAKVEQEVLQVRKQLAAEEKRANDSIEENVRLMNKLAAERENDFGRR